MGICGVCLLLACYSYHPVRMVRKIPSCPDPEKSRVKNVLSHPQWWEVRDANPCDGAVKGSEKYVHRVYIRKYFVVLRSSTPTARINNRAVMLAEKGKFQEALILLHDAVKEDSRMGAAYNNLGIIYEIFGDGKKSFEYYSLACLLEPDNEYFRKNLLFQGNDVVR